MGRHLYRGDSHQGYAHFDGFGYGAFLLALFHVGSIDGQSWAMDFFCGLSCDERHHSNDHEKENMESVNVNVGYADWSS